MVVFLMIPKWEPLQYLDQAINLMFYKYNLSLSLNVLSHISC